jgi:phosphoserine phosphatase
MHKQAISVFDLDGTIIAGNSFHMYIAFLARYLFTRLRLRSLLTLGLVMARRLVKRINHAQMKRTIVDIGQSMPVEQHKAFAKKLAGLCQPRLAQLQGKYSPTLPVQVLATAAPGIYAHDLARLLGFDLCIASDYVDGSYLETLGPLKAGALQRIIHTQGFSIAVLFTDHHDDLFAAQHASTVVLVDPSANSLAAFEASTIHFTVHRFAK